MGNGSRAAGKARAMAWQSRGEQAMPCCRELPGSHRLPPASTGTGRGHAACAAAVPRHITPTRAPPAPCPSQHRACQGRQALGCSQAQLFFNLIHPSSAQQPGLHMCGLSINRSITTHPHPNQPQGMRDLRKGHPMLMLQDFFQGHRVSYNQKDQNTSKMTNQNCCMRPSFLVSMSCGEKAKGSL